MDTTKARGPFTHKQIEALPAPPEGMRRVRYYEGPNLSIELERLPSGAVRRYWRYDYYRPAGGRAQMSLGVFPETGVAMARKARDEANAHLAKGADPAHQRASAEDRQVKEATTVAEVGALFIAHIEKLNRLRPSSIRRLAASQTAIERSAIGKAPIGPLSTDVEGFQRWTMQLAGEGRTAQARSLCQYLARVFDWAIVRKYASANPARITTQARDLPAHEAEHYRAVTTPSDIGELMRAIRGDDNLTHRLAVEFLALTFARPGNVWAAEWCEIDMDRALWTIPAAKMKKNREHVVPLSRQALAVLRAILPITGSGRYVFTGHGGLAVNTWARLTGRIGWGRRHTAHGFRAMASTILHGPTEHGFRPADGGMALTYYRAIEEQLAHRNSLAEVSGISAASARPYDRNTSMAIRVELMQWWADRLDIMRAGLRLVAAA
jgi:integrase